MAIQTQIINGQTAQPYTPAWYEQQEANAVHRAGVSGTAQGTGEANYYAALSPELQGLFAATGGGLNGVSGSSPSAPTVSLPSGAGGVGTSGAIPPPATIAPVDFSKANSAAFATAKDQAAGTAQASLKGLQQALAARGMTGGGYEAGQIGTTLAREANTIGAASNAEAQHEADLAAQASGENLAAQTTERGQTIGAQEADAARAAQLEEAGLSGGIAQRGQDIAQSESAANRAADLAKFRASQSLSILRSVMGNPNVQVPYVY